MRVMTYNVRSCRGLDGRVAPERIAEVIATHRPDVVALQELDMFLPRTGGVDQAELIARVLNMEFHFHPSFRLEEGYYGNAVLSRFPMALVKADGLPTVRRRKALEQRGAIWTCLETGGGSVNFLTTHLGLAFAEKMVQARELIGNEWLGSIPETRAVVLCGDLNVTSWSPIHRIFRKHLLYVRPSSGMARATFPSRLPLLRLDHIFVSRSFQVQYEVIPQGRLERVASDHLPVVADLEIPGAA